MSSLPDFDILRPYNDSEVKPAINRIINHPYLKSVLSYIYPDQDLEFVVSRFKEINTVTEFQHFFSHHAVHQIVKATSTGLTYTGLEKLENNTPYLFIANHHDIVLDSAIMQAILLDNNHKTTQITFGSNLMKGEMIIDIGKLNKMFTIFRGGSKMEKYRNAILHSSYIRHVITQQKESIWIAQRDGRTKNGDDRTQSGLIKMFVARRKDFANALKELNIVPICTSYEYIPCDVQKAREIYLSRDGKEYIKAPDEDYHSIVNGITGFKGKIDIHFCTPMNEFFDSIDDSLGLNEIADLTVAAIDKEIHTHYKLRACNYISLDELNGNSEHLGHKYSETEKVEFMKYIDSRLSTIEISDPEVRTIMFEMYAKPILNSQLY